MKYYVYEHWLDGKCFYVGKGCGNRAYALYDSKRCSGWLKFCKGRKNEIEIRIVKEFENEQDAYNYEKELSLKMKLDGHPITGIADGNSLFGKNNGFYNKKHNEEFKKRIAIENKNKNLGEKNPMFGKRSASASYVSLYKDNIFIKKFDSLKKCKEWLKENYKGFPLKATRKMFQTGEPYKAFHSQFKRFDGFKIVKEAE